MTWPLIAGRTIGVRQLKEEARTRLNTANFALRNAAAIRSKRRSVQRVFCAGYGGSLRPPDSPDITSQIQVPIQILASLDSKMSRKPIQPPKGTRTALPRLRPAHLALQAVPVLP